jgi:rhodanese-related sulfurtransferase
MKKLIIECSIIMILAAAGGFTVNLFHPDGFVFVTKKTAASSIVRIDTRESMIKFETGKALFLDARESEKFITAHIAGAASVPAWPDAVRDTMIRRNFDRINSPVELVIYCASASCDAAQSLAEKIAAMGYSRHIYLYKDGFETWAAKGNPTGAGE